MDSEGNLLLLARAKRTQEGNKQDAIERLVDLVKQALVVPKRRRETKPTYSSQLKRVESKRKHSAGKSLRRSPIKGDD